MYDIVKLKQGSAEWLRWRRGGFGASDIPVLAGENPWKKTDTLLREKAGHGGDFQNDAMRRGTQLEPEARRAFIERTNLSVAPICLQHSKYPWARASLDGLTDDGSAAVEIKCGKAAYREASAGKIPRYYKGQIQHIMFIADLPSIYYWCYLPGLRPVLIKAHRDDSYIERIIQLGEQYKRHLS